MRHSLPPVSPEVEAAHNPAFGAIILFEFSKAFYDVVHQTAGPSLPMTLLVSPICLHLRSARELYRMQQRSGLDRAVDKFPELPTGLQERVERMFDLTMASLSVAVASGLLARDPASPWPLFPPARRTLPAELDSRSDDSKLVLGAAKRLGWWMACRDLPSVCRQLHVRM